MIFYHLKITIKNIAFFQAKHFVYLKKYRIFALAKQKQWLRSSTV